MSNELEKLNEQGFYLLYDCKDPSKFQLNWNTKKTSVDEETVLFELRSYINQLVGYVCSCRFTTFQKVKTKKSKTITHEDLQDNPAKYICFYVVECEPNTIIGLNDRNIIVEPAMLLLVNSLQYKEISINTKEMKLLTINIHEYAI